MKSRQPCRLFLTWDVMTKPEAIIFDVNETLLNLEVLKNSINSALQNEYTADIWFSSLLHYSLVETLRGEYHDFSKIAAAVLKMESIKYDKQFTQEEIKKILSPVTKLKPYPDVIPGLGELKALGIKLIAFSNGKPSVLKKQLEFAEISSFFDKILSVDSCRKYKPHPDTYEYALNQINCSPENVMMVAAHGWDIAGAKTAGFKTTFIKRPGKNLYPLAENPDLELEGITSLAKFFAQGG